LCGFHGISGAAGSRFVEAEVGRAEFDFQEVGPAGEMERPRDGREAFALFEDVGDVFAGEGLEFEGVFESADDFVFSVDVDQGHDSGDVDAGVEAAFLEPAIVFLGTRAEGVEARKKVCLAGPASLVEEFLYVIGIFEVTMAFIAAGMGGDEVRCVIEAEAVGVSLQREPLRGVERRHRVAVAIQHDAAAVGDAYDADHAGVSGQWREGF
jgi:hypothetical protein